MVNEWLIIFVAVVIQGTTATKCSHCAYLNNGECNPVDCDGKLCAMQVTFDTQTSAALLHKYCEPNGQIDTSGVACANSTKGSLQIVTCMCSTDYCTNSAGSDVDLLSQMVLLSNLGTASNMGLGTTTTGPDTETKGFFFFDTLSTTTESPAIFAQKPVISNGGQLPDLIAPPSFPGKPQADIHSTSDGSDDTRGLGDLGSNTNSGLDAMETVISERAQYFSAVSMQKLPTVLAADLQLMSDKEHYDVVGGRIDGDMVLNPAQINDTVDSERIFLPAKPTLGAEDSSSPNGILLGRDLEQANAWQQLRPIEYAFNKGFDEKLKTTVRKAIELWTNNTCVIFNEIQLNQRDQFDVIIESQPAPTGAASCGASTVGRFPAVKLTIWQYAFSDDGCLSVGAIAHEIGHILGLWHTQTRFDAYNYVYVMADAAGNVDVHPQSASQSTYDVGYDYGSIMHFAQDILRPKDPRFVQTIGQRRQPSFIDYKTINQQQKCIDMCAPVKCFVGGYTTFPNCLKCRCPSGFGGDRCETVQASVGDCGQNVGVLFAADDWQELSVTFADAKGADNENKCFWHIWGKNENQVELEVVSVNMHFSSVGCTDTATGERNFIEIKIGDNDADRSFDFQRTGFRLCNMDPLNEKARPIISTNKLIALAAYAGNVGTFTVRFRNVGGGNLTLAATLHEAGLIAPVRPGIRFSASPNATAQLLFAAGEERSRPQRQDDVSASQKCDIRRSIVPEDRLTTPCRILRSYYGRYSYVFSRRGQHLIFFNEKYFEPRILIYQGRTTPVLKSGSLVNDKQNGLRIEDSDRAFEAFPNSLSLEKQKTLGPVKIVITEDGRLVARAENGTEITLVCLAHFSCVRLYRRLQSSHDLSTDTKVMLQGGVLYSENRLFFATLSSRGEFAIWQKTAASDPVSVSASKQIWSFGPAKKDRLGQPYRLIIDDKGLPNIFDGDNNLIWRASAPTDNYELPTSFRLTDEGKLSLADAKGTEIWTNM